MSNQFSVTLRVKPELLGGNNKQIGWDLILAHLKKFGRYDMANTEEEEALLTFFDRKNAEQVLARHESVFGSHQLNIKKFDTTLNESISEEDFEIIESVSSSNGEKEELEGSFEQDPANSLEDAEEGATKIILPFTFKDLETVEQSLFPQPQQATLQENPAHFPSIEERSEPFETQQDQGDDDSYLEELSFGSCNSFSKSEKNNEVPSTEVKEDAAQKDYNKETTNTTTNNSNENELKLKGKKSEEAIAQVFSSKNSEGNPENSLTQNKEATEARSATNEEIENQIKITKDFNQIEGKSNQNQTSHGGKRYYWDYAHKTDPFFNKVFFMLVFLLWSLGINIYYRITK